MFFFRKQVLRRPSTHIFETLSLLSDVALVAIELLLCRFLESAPESSKGQKTNFAKFMYLFVIRR